MVGGQIRALRGQRRMTQEALAKKLNITAQAVSKWEQGVTSPDISLLPEIAELFGVSIDVLFGREPRTEAAYESRREALLTLYEASGSEEDFARAAEAYRAVFADGKPCPNDYSDYAFLYERRTRSDIEIAARYYKLAIEAGDRLRGPDWGHANTQYIHMLTSVGRGETAFAHAKEIHEREPENPRANLFLAWALHGQGENERALNAIRRAEALGADATILTVAGDICRALGMFDEAFSDWDRAFQMDSGQCACLYSKAETYEALGDREKAITEYEGIIKWHERQGFSRGVEDRFAREKIEALQEGSMV
jgi:transcriptional regulator with XRE-family HTH domain